VCVCVFVAALHNSLERTLVLWFTSSVLIVYKKCQK